MSTPGTRPGWPRKSCADTARAGRWALAGLVALAATLAGEGLGAEATAPAACAVWSTHTPVVPVGAETLVPLAAAIAERNEDTIARIDSWLRSGAFGPPADDASRRRARAAVKISSINVYHFLYALAGPEDRVLEVDGGALDAVYRRYAESGLFPSALLTRGRLGLGHVCLHYDLSRDTIGSTILGGLVLEYRVKDERIDGLRRRVLSVVHPSGTVSHFEALVGEHYCFEVSRTSSPGPPAPYELYAFHDMEGAWIRRWGVHRPTAFLFWASPPEQDLRRLPDQPLAGIRVYIPGLRLDVPILSAFGLDDLRTLQLPAPLLRLEYVRGPDCPSWLITAGERFAMPDWQGLGPTPSGVRERFPDR